MPSLKPQRKWTYRADRLAAYVVRFGGITIIFSVLAILFFISLEAYPLIRRARAHTNLKSEARPKADKKLLDVGQDEQGEIAYLMTSWGTIDFISLKDGRLLESISLEAFKGEAESPQPEGEGVVEANSLSLKRETEPPRPKVIATAAYHTAATDVISIGTSDGRLLLAEVKFRTEFEAGQRRVVYRVSQEGVWQLGGQDERLIRVTGRQNEESKFVMAGVTDKGRLLFLWFDPEEEQQHFHDLTPQLDAPPTAIALTYSGNDLLVGTRQGWVYHWDVSDPEGPQLRQRFQATASINVPVTALEFLIGDESLVVGDAEGHVDVYFRVREVGDASQPRFHLIRRFGPQKDAITHLTVSPRNKGFLVADHTGEIQLCFSTSHRTVLRYREHTASIEALAFAPKGNGALSLDASGMLRQWKIHAPHPEVSTQTLFGKVWYENYPQPEFVWQTTGTNEAESKFSLIPLIFGTLKATLYAMLFSVPAALLGAFYTSQFAPTRLRAIVKPAVELMASIPSVVIGFLAGLCLAPLLEKMLLTSFLVLAVTPIFIVLGVFLWQLVPQAQRNRISTEIELGILLFLLVTSVLFSYLLAGPIEVGLLGGDVKGWLSQTFGVNYDSQNAIVVGFALGFAVIPIIYTLAEDALSNVPQLLVSAALALGASRAQAALWVVLPAASPGIFAALMLGLGRAVGETMIVLMASGNAPILDWIPFIGMRTMSAAIAIEIPEAPRGETLYRILFLVAALLFLFTFLINTLSELIGTYLRKRYSRF